MAIMCDLPLLNARLATWGLAAPAVISMRWLTTAKMYCMICSVAPALGTQLTVRMLPKHSSATCRV